MPIEGTVEEDWARQTALRSTEAQSRGRFARRATPIVERHSAQDAEAVHALRQKYAKPVFGRVRVWDLIQRLRSCVDPTDARLYCASQQIHVLQMLEAMEEDGTATPEMVLVTLIHDLGKVLLLTGEDPANVVCMNRPVGDETHGAGLDQTLMQWNHDEFAYQRLRDHVSDDDAWLIRYHSVEVGLVSTVMDQTDLERTKRLLLPFTHYDHATKSPFNLPPKSIDSYREVVEAAFPRRIRF